MVLKKRLTKKQSHLNESERSLSRRSHQFTFTNTTLTTIKPDMAKTNQSGRGCGGKGLGTGGKKHRKVLRNNIQGLETHRLAKLASEAEITRICSLNFEELRGGMTCFVNY
jgi:hypothetical protein